MMLKLRNISKSFREKIVLQDYTCELPTHTSIGFSGANGSGKTTLMKIIAGLVNQDDGLIFFEDQELKVSNKKISYVDSNHRSFFQRLSVKDNLYYFGSLFGKNKKQMESFIEESIEYLPISEFIENKASNISLGQAQILNILRGTLYEPDIILFDEVFSALDTNNEDKVFLYLKNFNKKKEKVIYGYSSNNPSFLKNFCKIIKEVPKA